MSDRDDFISTGAGSPETANESSFEDMSIDDLIRSTREDIARVERQMGDDSGEAPAETPKEEPAEPFEPELPAEYADLTLDTEEPEPKPEENPKKAKKHRLPAGVRVLIYVFSVLVVSVALAVFGWKCADDLLALTKPDEIVSVTVTEGESMTELSADLQKKGLIRYPWLFRLYCQFSHAEDKIDAGTYELNCIYDYHALVNGMVPSTGIRATVMVTIPEGYICEDIFTLLEENGVCSAEELKQAAANDSFDYDFLDGLDYGSENRLEGYLFPDTYEFYVGDDADRVLEKMLSNFNSKLTEEYYEQLDVLNATLRVKMEENGFTDEEIEAGQLTLHDVIIVASLIEKESGRTSESAEIASVIYNRLCSKLYPCLEIDATIQYALSERKEVLSNADKTVVSPYNTYMNAGLPAGPISNPGMNSIRAALYPAETNYYFYALGNDGLHHFSETYYEHLAFLDSLESETDADASEEQSNDTAEP